VVAELAGHLYRAAADPELAQRTGHRAPYLVGCWYLGALKRRHEQRLGSNRLE
jgi:hypothetical protein